MSFGNSASNVDQQEINSGNLVVRHQLNGENHMHREDISS